MKTLIAYFSWSGNTKEIAEKIQAKTNADLYRIETKKPYSRDYHTCAYIEAKKEADEDIHPEVKKPLPNLDGYENLILCFPIWWYTCPKVICSFLEAYPDFHGKKIFVFANAYSDIKKQFEDSIIDCKKCAPTATIVPGLFNQEINGLDEWIKNNL